MKLTKRKGFNFYRSYFDIYNELTDKCKLEFIDALLNKQFLNEDPKELKGMSKFAYLSQLHSIEKQVKGYEDATGIRLNDTPNSTPMGTPMSTPASRPHKEEQEKEKEKEKETINKELQPIFDLWIKYRDEIKKSIKSESTLNSLIKKMNSHTIGECDYIINLSISNQWQGLFWDKLSDFKSDTSATKKLQTNEVKFRWFSDPNTMVRTMDKDLLIKTAEQAIGGGDYPIYL